MHEWWITQHGREPIGPVTTDRLMRGIAAGKVPVDSLVCEVGGQEWRALADVDPFATAVVQLGAQMHAPAPAELRSFDGAEEHTIADAKAFVPPRRRTFDTLVDEGPLLPPDPSAPPALKRFDETEERTVADADPILPD